jgi:hypothetical protein
MTSTQIYGHERNQHINHMKHIIWHKGEKEREAGSIPVYDTTIKQDAATTDGLATPRVACPGTAPA